MGSHQAHPRRLRFAVLAAVASLAAGVLITSAVAAPTSGVGGTARPHLKGTITIGAAFPLTGGTASLGVDQQRAVVLAESAINSGSGVLGRKLKVITEDTEGTSVGAVQAARKLVTVNNVPLVVGEILSSDSVPMGKYLQQQHVPMISPGASSDDMGTIGNDIFSTMAPDSIGMKSAANTLYKAGYRSIAILVPNNSYGTNLNDQLRKYFTQAGGQIKTSILYTEGQSSYTGELTQLENSGAQIYCYGTYLPDAATIIQDAFQLNIKPTKFFGLYLSVDAAGPHANAAAGQAGFDFATPNNGSVFARVYKAKYHKAAWSPYSANTYDSIIMAAKAINMAHSAKPAAIQAALKKIGRSGFVGPATGLIRLDGRGERVTQVYGLFTVASDGSLKHLKGLPPPSGP
jgi:branched-chain amino acid transport system substrate-binding protein